MKRNLQLEAFNNMQEMVQAILKASLEYIKNKEKPHGK